MKRFSIEVDGLTHGDLPIPTACRIGVFLATGGIRGVDRKTQEIPADPALEVEVMFENLAAVLNAGGATPENVLKVTIWIKDSAVRPMVNSSWVKWFPDSASRPARHILIADLPSTMKIQCEALAVCDG